MGGFNDIVRSHREGGKRFKLGLTIDEDLRCVTHWVESLGVFEPVIKSLDFQHSEGYVRWTKSEKRSNRDFDIKANDKNFYLTSYQGSESVLIELGEIIFDEVGKEVDALQHFMEENRIMERFINPFFPLYSFAPVRARPKRTYDPISENENPEGDDVPMFLMRMKLQNREIWENLKENLEKFGKKAGLFQVIDIRKFGKTIADPFQIQVKVKGKRANIVDVGYGISQILPLLVRLFHREGRKRRMRHFLESGRDDRYFLMQQPEVHLHPKAQAEFTSLLAGMAVNDGDRFIVETHSDYMIDRIRIEIMNGKIKPDDVALNYLEADKSGKVTVHNIRFDEKANLENVPRGYRKFFSRETDRLIGLIKD